jgi:hypothetical protein
MSPRLRVIANLVLALVLGSMTVQARVTPKDYELGQTARTKMVLAQAWWTVAGQTVAQKQERASTPSRYVRRRR